LTRVALPHRPFLADPFSQTTLPLLFARALWPGVPVYLCSWHVKQNWLKALNRLVHSPDSPLIWEAITAIMQGDGIDKLRTDAEVAVAVQQQLAALYEAWHGRQPAFVAYFQKEYGTRAGERLNWWCWCAFPWGRGGGGRGGEETRHRQQCKGRC
jgi:hypothetical protein